MDLLISAKDLYNLIIKEEDITVVDTRSFLEYKDGHVPRSVNIDLFQLHWFDTSKRGIKDFTRQTRIMLSNIGIRKSGRVLFYDNVSGTSSARGVWLMHYFSRENASMLDGGFEEWKTEGYPIEIKSNPLKYSKFTGKVNFKILATAKEIGRSLKKKKVVLLDARSVSEYVGTDVRAARRGHIPFARNFNWENNIERGKFKRKNKLSKIYSSIPKSAHVVTYCQGGYRAANAYIALKLLGYKNVKMYLGSWGEWGNSLSLPVEIGH